MRHNSEKRPKGRPLVKGEHIARTFYIPKRLELKIHTIKQEFKDRGQRLTNSCIVSTALEKLSPEDVAISITQ